MKIIEMQTWRRARCEQELNSGKGHFYRQKNVIKFCSCRSKTKIFKWIHVNFEFCVNKRGKTLQPHCCLNIERKQQEIVSEFSFLKSIWEKTDQRSNNITQVGPSSVVSSTFWEVSGCESQTKNSKFLHSIRNLWAVIYLYININKHESNWKNSFILMITVSKNH